MQIIYGMCNLKIIVVVVTGEQCFVQLVVCNRMQHVVTDPAAVISVDHFAHKPEIRFHFIGSLSECLHEIKIQNVCGIKADAIDIKLAYPETNHIADVIFYCRIALVQFYKQIVTAPVFVRKTIVVFIVSAKIDIAVPVKIGRRFALFQNIPEGKEVTPGVVKYTIKYNVYIFLMTIGYKIL